MKRILLALLLCLVPVSSFPSAAGTVKDRSEQPIELKANELFSDSNNRTATFMGKVSAKQGDITIFSDKLVIHYGEQTKDVDRVEATGNVNIVQGDRRGQAAHAVYDNRSGVIVLDGNPKVYEGDKNTVTGRVITYYLDEQKSTVSGGSKPGERVEVTIYPKPKGKDGTTTP